MFIRFRQALLCLLMLWLPVSWAAESGWLQSPDNDHASVRLRADTSGNNETRLLLDVKLEKGWKNLLALPWGRRRCAGHYLAGKHAESGVVLAHASAF
ncbi:Uncharacterised protein [Cedecea neteri]|uniref:Uncharacterized protein n=1 Tax=Cedecea neteri TaxID=158822 RepID=A0A2X3IED5_9ENTR|nr:Uncharacterised protein [Cedecea neteri]